MRCASQSGRLRSSSVPCRRDTTVSSSRMRPGSGSAVCRTWYSRSNWSSSTHDSPVRPGRLSRLRNSVRTGASARNWAAYGHEVRLGSGLQPVDQALLSDPQTSGGLLVSCDAASVDEVLAVFRRHGFADAAEVGSIVAAEGSGVRLTVD